MNLIIQKMDQLIDAGLDNLQEDIDIECKLALGKDGKGESLIHCGKLIVHLLILMVELLFLG